MSHRLQFINTVIGSYEMAVEEDLNSCTTQLQHAYLPTETYDHLSHLKGRHILLLDTPGCFNHTNANNVEILKRITVWLSLWCALVTHPLC